MPNWICGTLKIRGKNENILRFFNEGLNAYGFSNGSEIVLPRDEWVEENHNDEYHYHEMKIIEENYKGTMEGYEDLKDGEHFVYTDGTNEWFGIKVDDKRALLLNAKHRWIEAKKFKNMLSIGGEFVHEYDSVYDYEKMSKRCVV